MASLLSPAPVVIANPATNILLGQGLMGKISELRIWNISKPQEVITRDFSRFAGGFEPSLLVYLPMTERQGDYAYDRSRRSSALFNRNHALLSGGVTWDLDIPSKSQLSYAAYTDTLGNYILTLPYANAGENYTLTPRFLTHQFNPANKLLFVGDGSTILNAIDFEDISAFNVTGRLFYKNTTCPVEQAFLKVDGVNVIKNGLPVQTDEFGNFEMNVPIGRHFITIEKPNHVMSAGRFPPTGEWDFQAPVSNIEFRDSTLVRMVGRVVGGLRETAKKPGLGKSKNNIGVAKVRLLSQAGGGCLDTFTLSDATTGEYSIMVPPLRYVPEVDIVNNPTIDFGVLDLIDLSTTLILSTVYDTLKDGGGNIVDVDSVKYHLRKDYVHRVLPKIVVKQNDGISDFIGDTTYTYTDGITGNSIVRNLKSDPLRWPVFANLDPNFEYRALIKVFEEYVNLDNPANPLIDSVPTTDGQLLFNNELADVPIQNLELSEVNDRDSLRFLIYSFKLGTGNLSSNISIPAYSFTNKFELNLRQANGTIIPWLPVNPASVGLGADGVYRGYILSPRTDGKQFVTAGPERPDYVLRDPPGSASKATREVGTTTEEVTGWSWKLGGSAHTQDKIKAGSKFLTGIGVATETDVKVSTAIKFEAEISGGRNGSVTSSTTNTEEWSTDDSALNPFPGAPSDIFIGTSENIQFGISATLAFVPESRCDLIECIGDEFSGLRPAKLYGLSIVPNSYRTGFIYTQEHIQDRLIKDLESLRNTIMQTNTKYTSKIAPGSPNYALNNDDPIFGASAVPASNNPGFATLNGPSYTYSAIDLQDSVAGDSVRLMNIQIQLWKDALALNEWEKVNIDNPAVIDSLKAVELAFLEEEYAGSEAAFIALSVAEAAGGIPVAYGIIANPLPGTAASGYATFAVTSALSIASAEVSTRYLEYKAKKQRILDRFQVAPIQNRSVSAGASYTSTMASSRAIKSEGSIEYALNAEILVEAEGTINNNGVGLEKGAKLKFQRGRNWASQTASSEQISFTIAEDNRGDFLSVDIYPSLLGWGPIFKRRAGGISSCPYEGEEVTKHYKPGTVISEATQKGDDFSISAGQTLQGNIPANELAVFNVTIANLSASDLYRTYRIETYSESNPFGAIVRIDGFQSADVFLGRGTSVNKVITIEKGPGAVYEYNNIQIAVYAECEPLRSEFIELSAHFLPVCTDVSLAAPEDQWVLNNFFNDTMPVAIIDYNINTFDLKRLRLDYKPSEQPNWIALESFWKDTTGLNDPSARIIPTTTPFVLYDWQVDMITDGSFDLRAVSVCDRAENISETHSGYMDRINPHAFGSPSPADGVLDPNDDILLKMNEPIEVGSVTSLNFDVRGVLNGSPVRHETSLSFDGTNDYATIPEYQLQKRSLTIEFWAKRNGLTGEQAIVSQGISASDQLAVSFDASGRIKFSLGDKSLTSNLTITDQEWRHYAITYNRTTNTAEIFIDFALDKSNSAFGTDYNATGPILVGKHAAGTMGLFNGFIHELRFWNIHRTESQITAKGNVTLSGRESGLIGNWTMDEAWGTVAFERVRSRHAQISGATWSILPQNHAFSFNGTNNYLVANNAGTLAFNEETDITLEAWFKTSASKAQSILSNGKADGTRPENFGWNLYLNAAGAVVVENDGFRLTTPDSLNNNSWHHVSVVIERTRAVSMYIDGKLVQTGNASDFKGFAGPRVWIGSRGWFDGLSEQRDQYFSGLLDDIRIWNTARKSEQIARDFVHQLKGDELGLMAYYPFDGITNLLGILNRTPDRLDASPNSYNLSLGAGTNDNYVIDAPPIKLPRLIETVNITYSLNNDEIFIDITDPPARVENVTLDITVSGLKDIAGNVMQSPETWIAYVNKNQVFWQQEYYQFTKKLEDPLSYTAVLRNTGGRQEQFTISNLPSWLSASPSSGLIEPNSSLTISFTVQPLLNIGEYEQDIFVSTASFGFNERLLLDLKVTVDPPTWAVNPDLFSSSMNITGQFMINNVISTDPEDIISVWVNNELRGLSNVQFDPTSGKHLVFLTILSNAETFTPPPIENLEFRAWDASRGRLLIGLLPNNFRFTTNQILGSRTTPIPISATVLTELTYPLTTGWNWISFPLASVELGTAPGPLGQLQSVQGDEIKSNTRFLTRDNNIWDGDLTAYNTAEGYKVKVSKPDTFIYSGTFMDPSVEPITIIRGWNWIGVKSEFIIDVATAMASLDPKSGDVIKGQRSFAIYEDGFGWGGNLQFLEPKKGYMLSYHKADTLQFPGNLNIREDNVNALKTNEIAAKQKRQYKRVDFTPGKYGSTMSLVAAIDVCAQISSSGDVINLTEWQLAAYANGECRGVEDATWVNSLNKFLFYLSIDGETSVALQFKLINKNSNEEINLNQGFNFANNAILGKQSEPYLFTCEATADCADTVMFRTTDIDQSSQQITKQARLLLQSNATLPAGLRLVLRAGNAVEFLPLFEVASSTLVEVNIEDCDNSNN